MKYELKININLKTKTDLILLTQKIMNENNTDFDTEINSSSINDGEIGFDVGQINIIQKVLKYLRY